MSFTLLHPTLCICRCKSWMQLHRFGNLLKLFPAPILKLFWSPCKVRKPTTLWLNCCHLHSLPIFFLIPVRVDSGIFRWHPGNFLFGFNKQCSCAYCRLHFVMTLIMSQWEFSYWTSLTQNIVGGLEETFLIAKMSSVPSEMLSTQQTPFVL